MGNSSSKNMSEAPSRGLFDPPPAHDAMLGPTRVLRASWSSTLRLPKSSFPPRPSPATNAEYLRRCTDDLYAWQQNSYRITAPNASEPYPKPTTFTLHDGPPYANGPLHIGHALNKITKDIICRFQVGQGKKVSYIPGWDCHGLPIEIKALQSQNKDATQVGPVSVREVARELATRAIEDQKHGFKEWAVMGDWDNAYKTMEPAFELRQLEVFKVMFEKGLIYRQNKPVHWSPSSRTALAEAELEYDEDHQSLAAFVRYPVHVSMDLKGGKLKDIHGEIGVVIWTTTPWTLPANSAIAVHGDLEYYLVKGSDGLTLVAASRLAEYEKVLERELTIVLTGIRGSDLGGHLQYENPFQKAKGLQLVIHADFVTDSTGTGLVHMAAGHGMDDYHVCHELGMPAFAPVDDAGAFTKDAFPEQPELLEGLFVADEKQTGSNAVCDYLESQGFLQAKQIYRHKYPIDWRTKEAVITRATEQWFANVESIKDASMKAIADVQFIPETGRSRLQSFIQGRSQWCISRQRAWGVPIPALYKVGSDKREALMNSETIQHIIDTIKHRGIDAWWTDAQDDPVWMPEYFTGKYVRGKDTMDVWFDSGTTWTLLPEPDDGPLADVYLEGTDQHRGWFQSSLLTHVATQPYSNSVVKAPYKTLITHGFTLDSEGRKMSKSLGNVVSPSQIMSGELLPPVKRKKQKGNKRTINGNEKEREPTYDAMGSDALRLWVASSDYTRDISIGQPVLEAVNQALHKYRVTFKWLLGIFSLPTCPPDFYSFEDLRPGYGDKPAVADMLATHRLLQVSHEVHYHYSKYEFYKGVNTLNKWIANDLSAFYFETLKDGIYTGSKEDCQNIQHILGLIFYELLKMLAPITPLLVEEVWDHVPTALRENTTHPARAHWIPGLSAEVVLPQEPLAKTQRDVNALGAAIKTAQERLRAAKKIGSSLESAVIVHLHDMALDTFFDLFAIHKDANLTISDLEEQLASLFVVSGFRFGEVTPENVSLIKEHTWYEQEVIKEDAKSNLLRHGATVVVHAPSGEKCPRCWRFVREETEELCKRCAGVLEERMVKEELY